MWGWVGFRVVVSWYVGSGLKLGSNAVRHVHWSMVPVNQSSLVREPGSEPMRRSL